MLFIEDFLITKAINNPSMANEFVTYEEAPTIFKVVDKCKEKNSFFGCIVMICGSSKTNLIEKFNFHILKGFQIVGYPPGTNRVNLVS